jgi:hypothetical protein
MISRMIRKSTSMANGDSFLDGRMKRRRVIDQYHQRRMEPSTGPVCREQAEWAQTMRYSANGSVIAF